jgi:hypothetical protein
MRPDGSVTLTPDMTRLCWYYVPGLPTGTVFVPRQGGTSRRRHSISRGRSPNIVGRSSYEAQAHEDDLRVMKGKGGGNHGRRRQHKNFSNRPETSAPTACPDEGEPSRVFWGWGVISGVNRVLATERNCGVSREVEA